MNRFKMYQSQTRTHLMTEYQEVSYSVNSRNLLLQSQMRIYFEIIQYHSRCSSVGHQHLIYQLSQKMGIFQWGHVLFLRAPIMCGFPLVPSETNSAPQKKISHMNSRFRFSQDTDQNCSSCGVNGPVRLPYCTVECLLPILLIYQSLDPS